MLLGSEFLVMIQRFQRSVGIVCSFPGGHETQRGQTPPKKKDISSNMSWTVGKNMENHQDLRNFIRFSGGLPSGTRIT
jgi:hypothetical protein